MGVLRAEGLFCDSQRPFVVGAGGGQVARVVQVEPQYVAQAGGSLVFPLAGGVGGGPQMGLQSQQGTGVGIEQAAGFGQEGFFHRFPRRRVGVGGGHEFGQQAVQAQVAFLFFFQQSQGDQPG